MLYVTYNVRFVVNNDEIIFKILKFLYEKHFAGQLMKYFDVDEIISSTGLVGVDRNAILGNMQYLHNKKLVNGLQVLGSAYPISMFITELGIDEFDRLNDSQKNQVESTPIAENTMKTRNLFGHSVPEKWIAITGICSIAIVGIMVFSLVFPDLSQHEGDHNKITNTSSSTVIHSSNQSGGITANQVIEKNTFNTIINSTINNLPPQRHLEQQQKDELNKMLSPYMGKSVQIDVVTTDLETFQYASEIKDYLLSEKWNATGVGKVIVFEPIYDAHIKIKSDGNLLIFVGPPNS